MALAYTTGVAANLSAAATSLTTGTFTATAGRELIVGVALQDTTKSVSSITDTAGNTYSLKSSASNSGNVRVELWRALSITGNASNAVTINFSGSTLASAGVVEHSGAGSQSVNNTASGTGSDTGPRV